MCPIHLDYKIQFFLLLLTAQYVSLLFKYKYACIFKITLDFIDTVIKYKSRFWDRLLFV